MLYTLSILATWSESGVRLSIGVVEDVESIVNLAVGLTEPIPTKSVDVDSLTVFGDTHDQPPADEPPIEVTVPQTRLPFESVWIAELALLQLGYAEILTLLLYTVLNLASAEPRLYCKSLLGPISPCTFNANELAVVVPMFTLPTRLEIVETRRLVIVA